MTIRPSHLSPQSQDESDGKGLSRLIADGSELLEHIRRGGAIGVPVFHRSVEFDSVAPQHDEAGVVLADTGKAIYEAAVRAQRVSPPQLMKGGENKIV